MIRTWRLLAVALVCTCLLTGCGCSHEWEEADCSSPKTCALCAETEGAPLGHQWEPATCTRAKTCSRCGAEEGPVLPHDFQRINGAMQCTMCGLVDASVPVQPPLYCDIFQMTAEEMAEFLNLEDQIAVRNNARFAFRDGRYYGQHWDASGNSLFITAEPGATTATLLDYGWAKNIYPVEDGVIYENIRPDTGERGIFRIRMKDGQYQSTEHISQAYGSMQVKDGFLYYAEVPEGTGAEAAQPASGGLMRCDLDGGNVTKILDKPVLEFYVFGNGILYQDILDGSTLHMCYPDGSADRQINTQISSSAIFDGEFIYYISPMDPTGRETKNYTVWRIRPDGTENRQVSGFPVINVFMVYGDYIYFCNGNSNSQLYRMKKDGTGNQSVTSDNNVYYGQILNGELKYTKFEGEYIQGNYLCGLDGSNLRELIPYA